MLAPPGELAPPPRGNPGSAAVLGESVMFLMYKLGRRNWDKTLHNTNNYKTLLDLVFSFCVKVSVALHIVFTQYSAAFRCIFKPVKTFYYTHSSRMLQVQNYP